ncbi:MAG TPA: serine hydrolase, partial [Phototrophicaceae bacterium]|nr:serine hydrolase [Phototrophicaceae bacterium]
MSGLFSIKNRLWLLVLLVVSSGLVPVRAQEVVDYWPEAEWRVSTPEEQGLNSAVLAEMIAAIQRDAWPVHSVTVIRNGYQVLDVYFHPYSAQVPHAMWSVTKSITSSLVGIAIAQGKIKSVDQPVLDFFPEYDPADLDPNFQKLQLKHLLTMTSGLDCADDGASAGWANSSNWVQFVLTHPTSAEPPAEFAYCNQASHLLAAIVERAAGTPTLEFARQNFFEPLGITQYSWDTDPQGTAVGAWGLQLTPQDMAKIGYLYLHGGQWNGQTIVPESWVTAATSLQSQKEDGSRYGYQWWVNPDEGYFAAHGYRGQMIGVVPEKNLLVIVTGALADDQSPDDLLRKYVLPAIQTDDALPPNTEATTRLTSAVAAAAHPAPTQLPLLPPIAQKISGKTFPVIQNIGLFDALIPHFTAASATATFTFIIGSDTVDLTVGLDGVYAINETQVPLALRASWK